MPIIINDMEIVADPPGADEGREGAPGPSGSGSEASPPVSPALIRAVLDREGERLARLFAH